MTGRIVFVAVQTRNLSDGGLESSTRIFEALAKAFRWTYCTNRDSGFTQRWRARGAELVMSHYDHDASRLARSWQRLRWAWDIARACLRERPSLIHANDSLAFQAASLPARLLRIPVLLTTRDTKAPGEAYGRHWRLAAHQCRYIVTLSTEMAEVMRDRIPAPASSLVAINSIVDLARFRPLAPVQRLVARARLGMSQDEFAIACIGAVRDKKDQLGLIRHLGPALRQLAPQARLHFYGDFHPETDAYCAECRQAVEELGLPAQFHGHHDDMAALYPALDAIVVGSRNEGLARCMIEGMACAVPVVSFAVCSAREMLEQTDAGIVVEHGDYASMAGALARLANDPSLRVQMGNRARALAELRFAEARISGAYQDLYEKVIHERHA